MSKKTVNLMWTPLQVEIAKLLLQGLNPPEVESRGYGHQPVFKVNKALKEGQRPPDDNLVDSGNPKEEKTGSGGNGHSGTTLVGATVIKQEQEMIDGASQFKLVPRIFTCDFTPIMRAAREAAVIKWGWDKDMKFEDFLDTILHTFFKDRGLILAGFYEIEQLKDEEVTFNGS